MKSFYFFAWNQALNNPHNDSEKDLFRLFFDLLGLNEKVILESHTYGLNDVSILTTKTI